MTSSRIRFVDLIDECLATLADRPGRTILTALGTVIGVGMLVSVLGLAATATAQVSARFDLLAATEVHVVDARSDRNSDPSGPFPADADSRLRGVNGVIAAGVSWTPMFGGQGTSVSGIAGQVGKAMPVLVASAGYFAAAEARVQQGRLYDAFHDGGQPVVVLGSAAASMLGVSDVSTAPAVFVRGTPFTVIGIVDSVERDPTMLTAVVIPRGTAEKLWGSPQPADKAQALLRTQAGAAQQVAGEAQRVLRPDHPDALGVVPPPNPRELRVGVNSDLTGLFLGLALVCLLIGMVGIAGTTLVAVVERIPEIGLRRAMGARRLHIVSQVLTESGLLAALGGVVGVAVGTVVILVVAAGNGWSPVIEPLTLTIGPIIGIITGLVAGAYPAYRAGNVQPSEALRR